MSNLKTVDNLPQQQTATGFDLQPRNIEEAMKIATMIANSQLAPKDFRGRPEDTLVAMMMGNELGLNPMQAIQNIAVINGRPSIWGDAMLALVQNHPAFDSIKETFDDASMTAICTVKRKGGEPHTVKFSQADAQTAGLWGKNTWSSYPKRMLQMRARGFALRDQFSDALCGLITREEAMDYPAEEPKDVNPVPDYTAPAESSKTDDRPDYQPEVFAKNLNNWVDLINAGKATAQDIINKVESIYRMSEEQKKELRSFDANNGGSNENT